MFNSTLDKGKRILVNKKRTLWKTTVRKTKNRPKKKKKRRQKWNISLRGREKSRYSKKDFWVDDGL